MDKNVPSLAENEVENKFLDTFKILLAPLAGVSDMAFRVICQNLGADLTFVEMISAKALVMDSQKTLQMMERHPREDILGIQITGDGPEIIGKATQLLNKHNFDHLDLNMGCPVKKVVKTGCGSALIRDPDLVYKVTKAAVDESKVPVSVKIRLGWDENSKNFLEVGDAVEKAGAVWLTVHGRTRSARYDVPVDLGAFDKLKKTLSIPVIGNGNIFNKSDLDLMIDRSNVDGAMVSRGALGNPWIFTSLKNTQFKLDIETWFSVVEEHLQLQKDVYKSESAGVICFRKHLLWYLKGWSQTRQTKERLIQITKYDELLDLIKNFVDFQISQPSSRAFRSIKENIESSRNFI
ncbi:MAG: tRNA dihydrouridine synthase DusB [Zetaproteobacteria bacterium]|nr:tRNA dihydrouridine synthase DusB [Pseudobdellovibrionaceae bacterium]